MAPPVRSDLEVTSIPDYPEYNEFIAKLRVYHEKRGTLFDPSPRVGSKHVDLLKLFNTVVERGGYDQVSDEKLAWRKLGSEFNLGTANLPALAFSLKTTFLKYLAAYEITTIHGKEPPPKEILEEQTAKGSGLLTRTMENYRPPNRRDAGALGNDNSEASGDDGTPVRDRNGSEEAPGSGGRVTRGLRQAPPQRILFQPDTQPSRHSRHATVTSHAPSSQQQPQYRGASTSYNPSLENMSNAVANYEPRPQMPLSLRPVTTPGNNPLGWARQEKARKELSQAGFVPGRPLPPKVVWPGLNFDGPNIYVRCLCALKSGIRSEQDYALHHLVKISMERGDKYKFDAFPGLAEALIEKALEVCPLFYDADWQIRYMEDGQLPSTNILDGLNGTKDILQKIAALPKVNVDDNLQTAEFSDALLQVNEAALTLRNMIMLEENAKYTSELYPLRDFLTIALNLPNVDCVVELKHYALDIAEAVTQFWHFDETDPLYQSLLQQLNSQDRGAILIALRSICRASMQLEENNPLKGIPKQLLQNIMDWTLLKDEEMLHACLDFLYQYTAVVSNVDFMVSELQLTPLINQLTRLLMHNVKAYERDIPLGEDRIVPAPSQIASLPEGLYTQIVRLAEPDRSSQWLRCLFEEDPDQMITQIQLWQAYQMQFAREQEAIDQGQGARLLAAAEFIKNVSSTFYEKAVAQVQAGPPIVYFIKGIRHRSKPVDFNGEEYSKCLWHIPPGIQHPGGEFHLSAEDMYKHILQDHLGATPNADGKFENDEAKYNCSWDRCYRFKTVAASNLAEIARHVKIHCPPAPSASKSADYSGGQSKKRKTSYRIPAKKQTFLLYYGLSDEKYRAAGVPLISVLVLRNLARNLPKTATEEKNMKAEQAVSLVEQYFKPIEQKLFEIMAHNKSLVSHILSSLEISL
ncbi:RSC complex subunit rsc9 [Hyphodiscus hymeniophilus]|uniref:RSC complex subunit rsc9 n=1 Tax=Hyphodiscus hymeniophilus TaxID=353542 RepID=A0A9P6VCI4_9HELO|nr:RSC complex subunit rsc9 [Hyphodiscus hymeniophilus]